MDLSQISTDDLKALQSGDLSKVSTAGLKALQQQTAVHQQASDRVSIDQISQDAQAGPSFLGELRNQVGNLIAGGVRGAGSIGATLLAPADAIARKANGGQPVTIGGTPVLGQDRRSDMDWSLQDMGADTNSPAFKAGKVGAEIAGTSGAGGALAKGLQAVPAVASRAPNLIAAIDSAGMNAGSTTGITNAFTRATGGAINGAVSSGMVDPSQAGSGAVIGAATPAVIKTAGVVGNAIGKTLTGPAQSPELADAISAARQAGYVIPPSQANPTLVNRLLEGLAGKVSTAQSASARNADVTNALVAKDVGLPGDAPITPDALEAVRDKAREAYSSVAGMGQFNAAGANLPKSANVQNGYNNLTLAPQSTVDAKDLVSAWKQANADKNAFFTAYGRDAQPDTLKKAQAAAADADSIHSFLKDQIGAQEGKSTDEMMADLAAGRLSADDFVRQMLQRVQQGDGPPGAVEALDKARTLIAKTYNVEKAANPVTGNVDARKLAAQQAKGKLLTGGLADAADFAGRFPKAAQTPEAMGSLPGTSPLDWAASALTPSSLISLLTLGARPAARKLALSPLIQDRLIQSQTPNAFSQLLSNDELAQLAYRAAPNALIGQ